MPLILVFSQKNHHRPQAVFYLFKLPLPHGSKNLKNFWNQSCIRSNT
jgi:hypothetical protein